MTELGVLWAPPQTHPALPRDEVHVWRASLDQPAAFVRSLQQNLSADELEKAEQFYFDTDRQRFTVARGLLRVILGAYLQSKPGDLRFTYNAYGKPFLDTSDHQSTISFNLSHSGDLALYALTRGRRIGVDLERVRPLPAAEQIATRFFSACEVEMLQEFSGGSIREDLFYACWTRKEAYIKARGDGLSMPLDTFDVSLAPGEPAVLLSTRADSLEAARWTLEELMPGSDFVATLAVEGHDWRLKCWQWVEQ